MLSMSSEDSSGRIWIKNKTIHYESPKYGDWEIPVCEIRVVGEHTNQSGPHVDDYFYVLLTTSGWYEASLYAEGRDRFLAYLDGRHAKMPTHNV